MLEPIVPTEVKMGDNDDGCGCGCVLMICGVFLAIGLIGLSIKFCIWAWRW